MMMMMRPVWKSEIVTLVFFSFFLSRNIFHHT
jgi:hypothetical protein